MEIYILYYKTQTDNAIGVAEFDDYEDGDIIWLPKSQIEYNEIDMDATEEGDEVEIEIPEWLAKAKGLL